jgi:hypothetical protein
METCNIDYRLSNATKASFDELYRSPTPGAYFERMHELGYQIGERANPFFRAAAALLRSRPGCDSCVRALDLGCSYGVGAALLNHELSYEELARFYSEQETDSFEACVEATRGLLEETRRSWHVRCLGLDSSPEAIRFATAAGLLDDGIDRNLEETPEIPKNKLSAVRRCSLMTSTGAIGYVGERTLSAVLRELGRETEQGPYIVVTILRQFDPTPVTATMQRHGYRFERIPGVRLCQRQFESEEEQEGALKLVRQRGLDTTDWESTGHLYADLFAGAPEAEFEELRTCLLDAHREESLDLAREPNYLSGPPKGSADIQGRDGTSCRPAEIR